MRIEPIMMRRPKIATLGIGLAALLLFVGAATGGQSSNPAQTIQNAKQQAAKASSGGQQNAQTPAPAKQQSTQAPPAKSQAPAPAAKQAPGPSAKTPPANPPAKVQAKTSAGAPGKAQASAPAKTQAAPAKTQANTPDQKPSKAPAKEAAKAPAKSPEKAAAQAHGKPAGKAPAKAAETQAKSEAKAEEPKVARRDPFAPLVNQRRGTGPATEHLPPGKAGLVIATLRIQGIVRGPNGMIAIVANPQQGVYFLREGDQLYDGRVVNIKLDEVAFHEYGKDAFGKPIDRQVSKRLYPIAGEQ